MKLNRNDDQVNGMIETTAFSRLPLFQMDTFLLSDQVSAFETPSGENESLLDDELEESASTSYLISDFFLSSFFLSFFFLKIFLSLLCSALGRDTSSGYFNASETLMK